MTSENRIMIDPSVALMELTIDANYSRDRRLYLANELHQKTAELDAAQQEITRLNAVIEDMQSRAAEVSEFDQVYDETVEVV